MIYLTRKIKIKYMDQKFIKLQTEDHEYHINPFMITQIIKSKSDNSAIVYVFGAGSIKPNESFDEVMKKINDSSKMKFSF